MGMSLSTARWAAPLAYGINFVAQQVGMNVMKPNMLDIHKLRFAPFSPYAWAIPLFFGIQQGIQIYWLYRLNKNEGVSKEEQQAMVEYAPTYVLGNLCIAAWLIFWNKNMPQASNVFVCINSFAQLYHVYFRLPARNKETNLTHWNAKTFAGIGILDFVHNTSAAYATGVIPPSPLIRYGTGLAAAAGIASSDWIMSGCIAYDLAALAVGQSTSSSGGEWGSLLALYAGGAAIWTALKYKNGLPAVQL